MPKCAGSNYSFDDKSLQAIHSPKELVEGLMWSFTNRKKSDGQ